MTLNVANSHQNFAPTTTHTDDQVNKMNDRAIDNIHNWEGNTYNNN